MDKARLLVAEAIESRLKDSLVHELHGKIELLENRNASQYSDFTNLLSVEKEKLNVTREIIQHKDGLITSYQEQSKYYEKKSKRLKRERNAIAALGLLLVGLTISL